MNLPVTFKTRGGRLIDIVDDEKQGKAPYFLLFKDLELVHDMITKLKAEYKVDAVNKEITERLMEGRLMYKRG